MTDEEFDRIAIEIRERLARLDKIRNELMREAAAAAYEPTTPNAPVSPLLQ
jgi:hypothetical protein